MGNSKIRRITMDAMMVAIFVVLAKFTIKAGPIHIAFSGLSVVFASIYFGLPDGLIVALLGETVIQLTSSYGITPTTPLWILPPAFRALSAGLFALPFRKKGEALEQHIIFYILANLIGAILVTLSNAGVEWIDGQVMGYNPKLTYILILTRAGVGLVSATLVGLLCYPLLRAVRKLEPTNPKKENPAPEEAESDSKHQESK